MTQWEPITVTVSESDGAAWIKTSFTVHRAILEREGPHSYFAAHLRFSPGRPVDLGRLESAIKRPLEAYLKTGAVAARGCHLEALQYAAEVFLLQRLQSVLDRAHNVADHCAALQCLNCKTFIPEELRGTACCFKPPRRQSITRPTCVRCGKISLECTCALTFPRHVFDSERAPRI